MDKREIRRCPLCEAQDAMEAARHASETHEADHVHTHVEAEGADVVVETEDADVVIDLTNSDEVAVDASSASTEGSDG